MLYESRFYHLCKTLTSQLMIKLSKLLLYYCKLSLAADWKVSFHIALCPYTGFQWSITHILLIIGLLWSLFQVIDFHQPFLPGAVHEHLSDLVQERPCIQLSDCSISHLVISIKLPKIGAKIIWHHPLLFKILTVTPKCYTKYCFRQ